MLHLFPVMFLSAVLNFFYCIFMTNSEADSGNLCVHGEPFKLTATMQAVKCIINTFVISIDLPLMPQLT